jgi:DNA invertase Pin-like site-specific DNA recombinase
MRAVGYVRRSKGDSDALGLARQRRQLREEADRRDWNLDLREEIESAVRGRDRPVLWGVISGLGRGDVLVVTRLDRLSRSVVDAGRLLELARRRGFNIVALDFGLDFGTPNGELVANVLTSVAQWEARIMGQRIREALAEKRERGDRAQASNAARARILELRAAGLTQEGVAKAMTDEGWEPPRARGRRGRVWHRSLVRRVIDAAA